VFKTIGLSPEVQLLFTPTFRSRRYLKDNETEKSDASYKGLEWLNDYGIEVDYRYLDKLMELSEGDVQRIRSALEKVRDSGDFKKTMSLSLDFAHAEVFRYNKNEYNNVDIIASINTLLDFNLITLMDMRLHKVDYGHMSLRQASSGEQCMLVILLGIAGNISDNSLVFIDEPEISLHPKWQEDFMSLLVKSFSKYKSCQFFIATHSPQMVSNLSNKNCFVTTMTSNKIFPSSYFYNMSSDFQLAEIFDAPGPKNEYMNRLAFTLLSKVKNKRSVSKENSDLLIKLLAMSETLDSDDPTYELVKSVEEVVKHYATDNKHY
jgi:predicted ATPase